MTEIVSTPTDPDSNTIEWRIRLDRSDATSWDPWRLRCLEDGLLLVQRAVEGAETPPDTTIRTLDAVRLSADPTQELDEPTLSTDLLQALLDARRDGSSVSDLLLLLQR